MWGGCANCSQPKQPPDLPQFHSTSAWDNWGGRGKSRQWGGGSVVGSTRRLTFYEWVTMRAILVCGLFGYCVGKMAPLRRIDRKVEKNDLQYRYRKRGNIN